MQKPEIIRYVSSILIIIGFFLPWINMGQPAEFISSIGSMMGEKISPNISGFKIGTGVDFFDFESKPQIFAVPVLVLLSLFSKKKWTLIVSPILSVIIIFLFAPVLKESGFMGSSPKDLGMTSWAYGKIITILGLIVFGVTFFLNKEEKINVS